MEETVQPSGPPAETTPSAPSAPEVSESAQPPLSFGEQLRATASGQAPAAEPDYATRLASEKAEWQKQYEWVGDLTAEQLATLREHSTFAQTAQQDLVGTATQLLTSALADPNQRRNALSLVGRILANGQTPQQQAAPQAPARREVKPIPALSTDGQTTLELYTAQDVQQLLADLKAELTGQLQPIQQAHQTAAEREAAAEHNRQQVAFAHDIFAKMSAKPGFKEHQAEIAAAFGKMNGNDDPYQARENLRDAYESVVYGKLQASASSATAADNARRAAASTGRVVSPQPTQASPSAPLSFSERLADEMARRRGA